MDRIGNFSPLTGHQGPQFIGQYELSGQLSFCARCKVLHEPNEI